VGKYGIYSENILETWCDMKHHENVIVDIIYNFNFVLSILCSIFTIVFLELF